MALSPAVDEPGVCPDQANLAGTLRLIMDILSKANTRLQQLLVAHRAAGEEILVCRQDTKNLPYPLKSVGFVCHDSHAQLTLKYGRGRHGGYCTTFTHPAASAIKLIKTGFLGYDDDGKLVRVIGKRSVEPITTTATPGTLKFPGERSVRTRHVSSEVAALLKRPGLIDASVARTALFNGVALGRSQSCDEASEWTVETDHVHMRSNFPRMWREHQGIMDYLVAQSIKSGLVFTVPARKILNLMGMHYTSGSIAYGQRAMQTLRDTVVECAPTTHGAVNWRGFSVLQAFEWSRDGLVRVTLNPLAVSIFKPTGQS